VSLNDQRFATHFRALGVPGMWGGRCWSPIENEHARGAPDEVYLKIPGRPTHFERANTGAATPGGWERATQERAWAEYQISSSEWWNLAE
jgi:hypothetical protein